MTDTVYLNLPIKFYERELSGVNRELKSSRKDVWRMLNPIDPYRALREERDLIDIY